MLKLLYGNEALALGVYHAGVKVASAYPGTPSTEILEAVSRYSGIDVDWASDEKVALEIALGAAYAGVRSMVSMKHVGLNVAGDPFMSSSITGINAGFVIINADDPGMHSSQSEQDNRYYAKFAKIPLLEPGDSQEAYDLISHAYDISEQFDTPVMVRSTTRISHSKSVVKADDNAESGPHNRHFEYNVQKYVLLPVYARARRPWIEQRLVKLGDFAGTTPLNKIIWGDRRLGIITSGVAYQYAREVFPGASFLKLGMTYPLSKELVWSFADQVEKLIVIEELDPFLEENIRNMGIEVTGKEFIPAIGELNPDIIEECSRKAGLLAGTPSGRKAPGGLPKRPPLLCPGCPHTGLFSILSSIGKRSQPGKSQGKPLPEPDLVICGDIGCYTLAAYPPLSAMDINVCMGASIGTALGMEKAGIDKKVVAVIGDSTFMHSGITGLINAVYYRSSITIIILDNLTTAMTGHQDHPGTGLSVQGVESGRVDLEELVRGTGVSDVSVVDAFDIKTLKNSVKSALDSSELSVIIVRGDCAVRVKARSEPKAVDMDKCNNCGVCLLLGCSAIQRDGERVFIDTTLCVGDVCAVCQQLCARGAIGAQSEISARGLE